MKTSFLKAILRKVRLFKLAALTVGLCGFVGKLLAAPPVNVSFGVVGVSTLTVSWAGSTSSLYTAVFSSVSNFIPLISSAPISGSNAFYSGLVPNTPHFFKVKVLTDPESLYSAAISTVTWARPPIPLSYEAHITSISVTLSTSDNPAGTAFVLSTGNFEPSASVFGSHSGGNATITLNNLVGDTAYTILARTINSAGVASPTVLMASTRTLPGSPAPSQPVVTDDGGFTPDLSRIHFTWSSSVLGGQIIEAFYGMGTSTKSEDVGAWTSLGTQTDFSISADLADRTTYYVFVFARSNFGFFSSTGVSDGIVTDISKPMAPASAPQITVQSGSLRVVWPEGTAVGPSGIASYSLEQKFGKYPVWDSVMSQASASPALFPAVRGVSGAATLATPQAGGTYSYRVRAVSGAGIPSDPSPSTTVNIGLNLIESLADISVYPNPFDSRGTAATINYALSQDGEVKLHIYDLLGQPVREMTFPSGSAGGAAGSNDVVWNGQSDGGDKVSKGIYIGVLEISGRRETFKIGVIH